MPVEKISRDDWIIGGIALLTAISLLFFPWFHVTAHVGLVSVSFSSSGTGSPDGLLGVIAMLAALALVADLAIERLAPQVQLPAVSGSRTMTRFVLAAVTAGFMALKFLFHIHFGDFGWGFYLSVVLVLGLLYVTNQARSSVETVPAVTPAV